MSTPHLDTAILVHVDFFEHEDQHEEVAEFQLLVAATDVGVATLVSCQRNAPHAKYFIGTGKAQEIHNLAVASKASLIIFNHRLSPAQERNLEILCKARVIDRTRLILDIFATRARTFEGKLQVELAQLKHLSTRLVRGWTHLERQKGGIGLRGPGETQLETDRRLLRARIKTITARLDKVSSQRAHSRRARQRSALPTISLVGYTNAGKSTLFNQLTDADVVSMDQLFATLDPTLRKVELPSAGPVILADTVGFIRHLPHDLVAAFRATLEETREASLLLHVIDSASATRDAQIEQVAQVLEEIGAERIPVLEVYNKIDLMPDIEPRIEYDALQMPIRVWVSAHTGAGMDALKKAIIHLAFGEPVYRTVCLAPNQGKLRAELYERKYVLQESVDDDGSAIISVCMPQADYEKLLKELQ